LKWQSKAIIPLRSALHPRKGKATIPLSLAHRIGRFFQRFLFFFSSLLARDGDQARGWMASKGMALLLQAQSAHWLQFFAFKEQGGKSARAKSKGMALCFVLPWFSCPLGALFCQHPN
jgi:hypothetical protein